VQIFDRPLASSSWWPLVLKGVTTSLPMAVISFAIGLVLAVLVAVAKLSHSAIPKAIGTAFVSIIRGTPLLIQLYLPFYVLPALTGVTVPPLVSAVLALSLNVAGYAGETIRGSIISVPAGQWEAAHTIGLNRIQSMRRIILPQALRLSVAPLANTFIGLVKDTSLTSIVMVTEMLRTAQEIATPTYEFTTVYIVAAVIYWIICTPLSFGQQRLETYLGRKYDSNAR
jgi:cystine transport system permease protein